MQCSQEFVAALRVVQNQFGRLRLKMPSTKTIDGNNKGVIEKSKKAVGIKKKNPLGASSIRYSVAA